MPMIPNVNLQQHNTLGVAATAAYYVSVSSEAELLSAISWAKEQGLPLVPLGGGSNMVLPEYLDALVVAINLRGKVVVNETDEHVWLQVGAGENWHQLVMHCLDFHYWGLENLALIPGRVGAAPIQNIGAYGVELESVFAELQAIEIASGLRVTFDRNSCGFGYRDSVFKGRLKDQYIITSVTLKLNKSPCTHATYPALKQALLGCDPAHLSPERVAREVCRIRTEKLPDPTHTPNAGSFFKNPVISKAQCDSLLQRYPNLVHYPHGGQEKLAAGWLIDQAGWKGVIEDDGVGIHDQQALVLINPGLCSSRTVLALAQRVADSVHEQFGVSLEIEPRVYA